MNEEIVALLYKCINGAILTEVEQKELKDWLAQSIHYRKLYREVMDIEALRKEIKSMLSYDGKSPWHKLPRPLPLKKNNPFLFFTASPCDIRQQHARLSLLQRAFISFSLIKIKSQA